MYVGHADFKSSAVASLFHGVVKYGHLFCRRFILSLRIPNSAPILGGDHRINFGYSNPESLPYDNTELNPLLVTAGLNLIYL